MNTFAGDMIEIDATNSSTSVATKDCGTMQITIWQEYRYTRAQIYHYIIAQPSFTMRWGGRTKRAYWVGRNQERLEEMLTETVLNTSLTRNAVAFDAEYAIPRLGFINVLFFTPKDLSYLLLRTDSQSQLLAPALMSDWTRIKANFWRTCSGLVGLRLNDRESRYPYFRAQQVVEAWILLNVGDLSYI